MIAHVVSTPLQLVQDLSELDKSSAGFDEAFLTAINRLCQGVSSLHSGQVKGKAKARHLLSHTCFGDELTAD